MHLLISLNNVCALICQYNTKTRIIYEDLTHYLIFDLFNPDCWDSDESPPPLPARTPESFILATGALVHRCLSPPPVAVTSSITGFSLRLVMTVGVSMMENSGRLLYMMECFLTSPYTHDRTE